MKFLLLGICTFFFLNLQAQDRIQMQGLIKGNDSLLQNVHVKNISSGKFSVSDQKGIVFLNIKAGDTLLLSHMGMQDLITYVKENDLQNFPIIFNMREISTELREVVVNETSEVNVVSVGIIPKKIEKLSINERRLKTAGDFKPIHLLGILGGSLPLDPILNAINGRTKRLKKNISFEKKEQNMIFLELHHNSYMRKEMKLSAHNMRLLINEVIEDEDFQAVKDSENEAQMQFFLQDRWIKFQEKISLEPQHLPSAPTQ